MPIESLCRSGVVLACVLAMYGTALAQGVPLTPDVTVTREAVAGATHSFTVEVGADQFVHLEVFQMGADAALTVLDPAGATLAEVDDGDQDVPLETVSWTRSVPGTHRVVVRVKSAVRTARIAIRIDPLRPSAPTDPLWLQCERDFSSNPHPKSAAEWTVRRRRLEAARQGWSSLGETRGAMRAQLAIVDAGDLDPADALESCLDVAEYLEATGDRSVETSLTCVASSLKVLGLVDEAIELFEEELERCRAAGDAFGALGPKYNLAVALREHGRTSEAKAHFQEGLEEARALADRDAQGVFLGSLGGLHAAAGELQDALDCYTAALEVMGADDRWSASVLSHLASVQVQLLQIEEAKATARRLLARVRGTPVVANRVIAHRTMAQVLAAQQRPSEALAQLQQALLLVRTDGHLRARGDLLLAMGRILREAGRFAEARRHLQRGLSLSRAGGYRWVEAAILVELCAVEDLAGTAGGAASCREALEFSTAIRHRTGAWLARYHLARQERRRGAIQSARALLEENLAEAHDRRQLLRRADLREAYAASVDQVEDEYLDLLVDLATAEPDGRWADAAFAAAESARGRGLRDQLVDSRARGRADAEGELYVRLRDLRDQIRQTLDRQLRQASGSAPRDREPLDLRLARLSAEMGEVEAKIQAANPRDAVLEPAEPASLESIRHDLLPQGTTLLFYALGERRSFLWVVTADTVERHVLPPEARIERTARRAIRELSTRGGSQAVAALSDMILRQAGPRLDATRLVVVPDGVLHYVPFGALPRPRSRAPLLSRAEIVHLPSITAGLMLAKEKPPTWTGTVAIFADPVFRSDDERVAGAGGSRAGGARRSSLRGAERSFGRLARLPFSRQEAGAIRALAQGSESSLALDFDATVDAAIAPDLSSYRFVHFATHGLIHDSRPELSGLVLSLVDREGRPREGFLTAPDAWGLHLTAELVVLSGCRTALGKEVRGEGIVGLTRAFMHAGARGTLASLWPVDDAATAELMRVFYAGLLGSRRLAPPAALREAQLQVRSDPRWSAPYYWAPFQLQGFWNAD